MSITVTLPDVAACDATACAYNTNRRCHASAITIGDGIHPMCDTFSPDGKHVKSPRIAGVGACKVQICTHNRDRICEAPAVQIAMHQDHPDCATFASK